MANKTHCIFYLIIVAVGFGACSPKPSITQQIISTETSLSPAPEHTLPVTSNTTPSATITASSTPEYPFLVTPRVTPLPARSPAEVNEQLNNLFQTNGDCVLPCFWGIHPDQTRYEELYGVIDQLQGRDLFDVVEENGHLRVSSNFTYEKKGTIRVALTADLQDDVVKDLKVTILNQLDTGITPGDWSAYNIDKILETYGVPDTVELYFDTPYDALSFDIRLKYENIHTSIMYAGRTTEDKKYLTPSSAIFCPEEIGIYAVVLHIGKHPFNEEPDGVLLSKATGIDKQAFHKLFTENPSACLTLNFSAMP
jgi:hypothetical protein